MKLRYVRLMIVLLVALSCRQGIGKEPLEIAREVADGVAIVRHSWVDGSSGPVFIFEEIHTSRIGQHQIAVMLLRLHDRYGLQQIGLEGAVQSKAPLNASWFHQMGTKRTSRNSSGVTKPSRNVSRTHEDVALRMMGEGEISAVDFLAMVFPDVQVFGLEKADEYDVKLNVEGDPAATYLLKIAEQNLTQADILAINELAVQGKTEEAIERLMNADPWVRTQFQAMKRSDAIDLKATSTRMLAIRAKAREMGITVEPQIDQEFDRMLRFFETASKRSETMASYMVELISGAADLPSAMIIGAAHTKEVEAALKNRGVSHVVLRPTAFDSHQAELTIEQFQRKNEGKWARRSAGTIGSLLDSDRKPPPFIGTTTAKSYASALLASKWMAGQSRARGEISDNARNRLADLPECTVHFDTVKFDGYDVIFRLTLKDVNGNDEDVWVRAGSTARNEPVKTLEERILQQIADLGWSGAGDNIPPREPPKNTDGTGDEEGPGDGKRDGIVVTRVSDSVVAVFTKTAEEASAVGRISS